MPSTSVNLKRLKRGKGHVYQIDYRVKGRRIREVVGTDKRTAELKRATIQQDLILGKLNLPGPTRKTVTLRALADSFLQSKKGEVRATSLQRYSNYSSRLVDFFESFLPIQAAEVSLIERKGGCIVFGGGQIPSSSMCSWSLTSNNRVLSRKSTWSLRTYRKARRKSVPRPGFDECALDNRF